MNHIWVFPNNQIDRIRSSKTITCLIVIFSWGLTVVVFMVTSGSDNLSSPQLCVFISDFYPNPHQRSTLESRISATDRCFSNRVTSWVGSGPIARERTNGAVANMRNTV